MKCFFILIATSLVLSACAQDAADSDLEQVASASAPDAVAVEDQVSAASSYAPLQDKKQEKRYVGGYGGYGAGYGAGYGGYGAGYGAGYGGYGSGLGAGYGGAYGSGVGVGVDSYYNPYSSRALGGLGEDGAAVAGYGGYGSTLGGYGSALGGYGSALGGYGSGLSGYGGSYNSNPYALSYYNSRLGAGAGTGYPYYNTRFGAGGYPSSYYTSNYGNSVVGGGLGALGGVPPIGSGYNYGSGISGTVY
ncbi:keratin-associated protein 6-2 isoform X1 [Drosophila simulans]|uniref:keratin-associated protein 6-2 isoform X1 n=1 Tax=Drosophila simulans TaxID=7240 RepID=UPI00078AEB6C|nr:keratin-associated protein 6-2 isoform X1 [Drosophila simulans]KMZ09158.1 uncharacterized protein Dsimw501_GD16990, isoform B [Drosophila simulans]